MEGVAEEEEVLSENQWVVEGMAEEEEEAVEWQCP